MSTPSYGPGMRPSLVMAGSRDVPDGGNKTQMTRAWKDAVIAALAGRGWNLDRLAKEVGISRAAAYRIWPTGPVDDEIWMSAVVPAVCELLGLDLPLMPVDEARDPLDARITELTRALPHGAKISLIHLIESLLPDDDR